MIDVTQDQDFISLGPDQLRGKEGKGGREGEGKGGREGRKEGRKEEGRRRTGLVGDRER